LWPSLLRCFWVAAQLPGRFDTLILIACLRSVLPPKLPMSLRPSVASSPFDYIKTPHTEYLFVTVGGPFGGARIFEVFCYEHTEHDIWRERGMVFVTYSPIMRPQFIPHGDTVDLVHEGEVLFTFGSAGAQERRNRQPRVGRANKHLEPTRLTPSVCSCATGRAAQAQR
jgi:hypothetical protein